MAPQNRMTILMADDDEDDRQMTLEAFDECGIDAQLRFVGDGEELLHYLRGNGKYAEIKVPRPALILLDLNMPKISGRAALKEIKNDPGLRQIPIVILTSSKAEEDISKTYDVGVNSYIVKPVTCDAMTDILRTLGKYWFSIVEHPSER